MAGKGEAEAQSMDHWVAVGQKLTAEKNLAEDVKKVCGVCEGERESCKFVIENLPRGCGPR